jgi:hypothetical protein
MDDLERYQILREFRSNHNIGDNLEHEFPDLLFLDTNAWARCKDLCVSIWPILRAKEKSFCPCTKWGCSTVLRKLDAWLRKEKKRLGVKE